MKHNTVNSVVYYLDFFVFFSLGEVYMAFDTYCEYHFKVFTLTNISNIYDPLSFFFIKPIPTSCKQ